MKRFVEPASRQLGGSPTALGDKSISHRALILGAIGEGTFTLENLSTGADVASTRRCLEALGARITDSGSRVTVEGTGARGLRVSTAPLDCGNSGTTMRLLMGVLAGQPFESVLVGDASLTRRPMERVASPLRLMGASVTLSGDGTAPITIRGRRPLSPIEYTLPVPSAQVKSAVLLAGLFADGITTVVDPFGTRDHTERMLNFLGGRGAAEAWAGRVSLDPFTPWVSRELTIPGDPSSVAPFAAAAVLIPGSLLTFTGLLLNPSRLGFYRTLREMGAWVRCEDTGESGNEPVGTLQVGFGDLQAVRVPPPLVPSMIDELPLLGMLAAHAHGTSRFEGLAELRLKESNRLEGIAGAIRSLGGDASVEGDDLVVTGRAPGEGLTGGVRNGRPGLTGGSLDTAGDHRLAMCIAVAGLASKRGVEVSNAECVDVSFPGFFEALGALGGKEEAA